MALPWVKIYTRLLDDDDYRRLSANARHTYLVAIVQAGRCGKGGLLELRSGPMTPAEFAQKTGIAKASSQSRALAELVQSRFLSQAENGAYTVERFAEFQGNHSVERMRSLRHKRKIESVTSHERHSDGTETAHERHGERTVTERCEKSDALDKDKDIDGGVPARDSAANYPRAGAHARESRTSEGPDGETAAFIAWFVSRGIELGAIPADRALDPAAEGRKQSVGDAEALLGSYGLREVKERAERFLGARARREIRRPASIAALRECWEFREVEPPRPAAPPEPGLKPLSKRMAEIARLRVQNRYDEIEALLEQPEEVEA